MKSGRTRERRSSQETTIETQGGFPTPVRTALCLIVSNGPQRSARRNLRQDSAIYAQIHEYPRTGCREGGAAAMVSMQRSSPHDPHCGTGQSMERILERYQACNSIHIM